MTVAVRRQITAAQVAKWSKATRAEKSQILDALCATTGWHRDHARKAIRQAVARGDAPVLPRASRPAVLTYGPAVIAALQCCWAVLDGPTGKRLQPALADLVPALRRHGELDIDDAVAAALLAMSPATIDRRLTADRAQLSTRRGTSLTRPGSMLKSSIPFKTRAPCRPTGPRF